MFVIAGTTVGLNPAMYSVTENQTQLDITVQVLEGQIDTNLTFSVIIVPDESTATEGQDFILLNQNIILGPETIEAIISVEIIDDSFIEDSERFSVKLLNCCDVSIQPSLAAINIEDNGKKC